MNYLEGEKSEVFESHKAKVIENINKRQITYKIEKRNNP